MVLEGLNFLPKIDTFQNRVLVVKCGHLVYKITKCVPNRDQFLLMFFDMTHAYEKFQIILFGFL